MGSEEWVGPHSRHRWPRRLDPEPPTHDWLVDNSSRVCIEVLANRKTQQPNGLSGKWKAGSGAGRLELAAEVEVGKLGSLDLGSSKPNPSSHPAGPLSLTPNPEAAGPFPAARIQNPSPPPRFSPPGDGEAAEMMQQQQQQLPPPPQHPPPQASGGGGGGEFYRGPPMRQLSAASSTNLPPDYAAHTGPPPQQQQQPPYDGNS